MLTRLIPATTTVLSQVFSIAEPGRDLFAALQRLDLEGIVAKRKADPYRPKTVWCKIKSRAYTRAEMRWELFLEGALTEALFSWMIRPHTSRTRVIPSCSGSPATGCSSSLGGTVFPYPVV